MIETKTIRVEERHLDAALAALAPHRSVEEECSQCVMGQALSEAFGERAIAQFPRWVYLNKFLDSPRWEVSGESLAAYWDVIRAFDNIHDRGHTRALLPATIILQREVEG